MLNCLGAKYIKPVLIHLPYIIVSISGRDSGQPAYRKPSPNQLFISCGGSFVALNSVYLNRTRWCSCIVVFERDLVRISDTLPELHENKWKIPTIYTGVWRWQETAVAQWLRCCATNRKVAGSIPDGDIGIFHWYFPSDRTMALGSTQPLTEMSTRSVSWGVKMVDV